MSCSKIFSGDLPELTYEVIKYFRNDKSTLHSCILVNRLWCRLAIPLLWEDPFSFRTVICNFIGIYLHNLNDDDLKSKLNQHIINNNSLPSNTLFNYVKFLKYLNIFDIISCVEMWFTIKKSEPGNDNFSATDFKRLIGISLFKIFIENEVNLNTLEIEISSIYYYTYFNDILEIILQNTNFIQNISNLNLYVNSSIRFSYDIINNEYMLIKNLSNCSNTLNTITFYNIDFKVVINLDKIFEQLNVLESVHIIHCYSLKNGFDQFNNLTKPFKLKSLIINELSQIDNSLQLLLQKSGDYLENFGYTLGILSNLSQNRQLLDLIIKYCENIKFLNFFGSESHIFYQIFNIPNLIENIKQNLKPYKK
ncbi:hypothetical protein RhiirA1_473981 [Rhizophagus irregularis]|uniref:F-box domain-containing protein n=1 Tax=Rhizophagus irregularis TaxID=588596 RepID=A0A2N0QZH0_9GLOM|nr:hypothetical protein RhiirA1_473981 [Rhizophagus irregularis]